MPGSAVAYLHSVVAGVHRTAARSPKAVEGPELWLRRALAFNTLYSAHELVVGIRLPVLHIPITRLLEARARLCPSERYVSETGLELRLSLCLEPPQSLRHLSLYIFGPALSSGL